GEETNPREEQKEIGRAPSVSPVAAVDAEKVRKARVCSLQIWTGAILLILDIQHPIVYTNASLSGVHAGPHRFPWGDRRRRVTKSEFILSSMSVRCTFPESDSAAAVCGEGCCCGGAGGDSRFCRGLESLPDLLEPGCSGDVLHFLNELAEVADVVRIQFQVAMTSSFDP
ncbi:hypothetical protein B296_00040220, partial [Ensete ventricosum]